MATPKSEEFSIIAEQITKLQKSIYKYVDIDPNERYRLFTMMNRAITQLERAKEMYEDHVKI